MSSYTCANPDCQRGPITNLPFTPGPGQKVYHRECMIYDRAVATELGKQDFEVFQRTENAGRVHKSARDAYGDGYHNARRAHFAQKQAEENEARYRFYHPPREQFPDTVGSGGFWNKGVRGKGGRRIG